MCSPLFHGFFSIPCCSKQSSEIPVGLASLKTLNMGCSLTTDFYYFNGTKNSVFWHGNHYHSKNELQYSSNHKMTLSNELFCWCSNYGVAWCYSGNTIWPDICFDIQETRTVMDPMSKEENLIAGGHPEN